MGSGFRTFQSGEVLTSSNVQNYLMDQAVTVFAGTAARGSAIASPETGMVSYRTDGTADSKREGFEFYDGAAWTRLVPATSASGLVVVKAETAISAASSVTVDNVFTSTYTNYRINLVYNTSTTNDVSLKLRASGTSSSADYNRQTFQSTSTTNTGANATGQSSFLVGPNSNGTRRCYATIDVSGPQTADQTAFQVNITLFQGDNAGRVFLVYGMHDNASAYDGFELLVGSGSFSGSYTVYGYGKSL